MVMLPDSGTGPLTLTGIDRTGVVTVLTQSDWGPVETEDGPEWNAAVGPTGVLVIRPDGGASWLGVPS